jgi:hypothetical protein
MAPSHESAEAMPAGAVVGQLAEERRRRIDLIVVKAPRARVPPRSLGYDPGNG